MRYQPDAGAIGQPEPLLPAVTDERRASREDPGQSRRGDQRPGAGPCPGRDAEQLPQGCQGRCLVGKAEDAHGDGGRRVLLAAVRPRGPLACLEQGVLARERRNERLAELGPGLADPGPPLGLEGGGDAPGEPASLRGGPGTGPHAHLVDAALEELRPGDEDGRPAVHLDRASDGRPVGHQPNGDVSRTHRDALLVERDLDPGRDRYVRALVAGEHADDPGRSGDLEGPADERRAGRIDEGEAIRGAGIQGGCRVEDRAAPVGRGRHAVGQGGLDAEALEQGGERHGARRPEPEPGRRVHRVGAAGHRGQGRPDLRRREEGELRPGGAGRGRGRGRRRGGCCRREGRGGRLDRARGGRGDGRTADGGVGEQADEQGGKGRDEEARRRRAARRPNGAGLAGDDAFWTGHATTCAPFRRRTSGRERTGACRCSPGIHPPPAIDAPGTHASDILRKPPARRGPVTAGPYAIHEGRIHAGDPSDSGRSACRSAAWPQSEET